MPREDVAQFGLDALRDDLGRVLAVDLVHPAVDQVLEYLGRILDLGREEAVGQELYLLAHVRDAVRVRDDRVIAGAAAEVGEFLEHLVRRAEVERVFPVRVGELLGRLEDAPVYLVLRVQEVHVSGGHERLFQLRRQARDPPVQIAQALVVADRAVFHQEAVVRQGHDLYVVVERGYLLELRARRAAQDGVEHLARLAGRAYEQALAVPLQQAARYDRVAAVVLEVGGGDELVEVFEPHLVPHQEADVPHLPRPRAGELAEHPVYVRDALRAVALEHGNEALHHPRHDLRVVKGAVVVELRQAQVL